VSLYLYYKIVEINKILYQIGPPCRQTYGGYLPSSLRTFSSTP